MVRGMGSTKSKKKPWKTLVERDIYYHRHITEAGLQGGKALGQVFKPKKKRKK